MSEDDAAAQASEAADAAAAAAAEADRMEEIRGAAKDALEQEAERQKALPPDERLV